MFVLTFTFLLSLLPSSSLAGPSSMSGPLAVTVPTTTTAAGTAVPSDADLYDAALSFLRTPSLHPPAPQQLTARFIRHWLEQRYGLAQDALLHCKATIIQATHDATEQQQQHLSQPHERDDSVSRRGSGGAEAWSSQPVLSSPAAAWPSQPRILDMQHSKRVKREADTPQQQQRQQQQSVVDEAAEQTDQPPPSAALAHRPAVSPHSFVSLAPSTLSFASSSSSSLSSSRPPSPSSAFPSPSLSVSPSPSQPPPPPPHSHHSLTRSDGIDSSAAESDSSSSWQSVAGQVLDIGRNKLVTVSSFRGATLVHIREYYVDESGTRQPGKKGIALTTTQWQQLVAGQTKVQTAIDQQQQQQQQQQYSGTEDSDYNCGGRASTGRWRGDRGGGGGMAGRRGWRGGSGAAAAGGARRVGRGERRGSEA